MARIAGVDIPRDKRVEIALTYIYGIGPTRSVKTLEDTKIDKNIRVKDLSDDQLVALRDHIEGNFKVEGELRRDVAADIRRKVEIGSYQGVRHRKGLPVISEIEFAARYTQSFTIGITGSNGKTTTTMLTYHLLKSSGLNVGLAGNIGKSFAWQVAEDQFDSYVLELSSFQLDGIVKYKPHIAIITNISPDHLDRYEYNYQNYIASKFRITKNQDANDYLIYDADDEAISEWLKNNTTKAQLIPFSLTKIIKMGAYLKDTKMEINMINEEEFVMETAYIALEGKHNMKNAMAATSVAKLMKIRNATIRESLCNFQGVEHRLEKVLKIQNVQYINDSKATNVNAAFFALDSMNTPTVWIVGGVDKGNDYHELMALVREKVKAVICLGVDNKKIIDVFGNVVDIMVEVSTMEDAVKMAQRLTEKGDTVLLSPACASFDLFENYEDRGNQFKQAVRNL
jgi:UDP-N-acetylmuramoylalanine--D-glutamate ligase